jgi:hypothetical protein
VKWVIYEWMPGSVLMELWLGSVGFEFLVLYLRYVGNLTQIKYQSCNSSLNTS